MANLNKSIVVGAIAGISIGAVIGKYRNLPAQADTRSQEQVMCEQLRTRCQELFEQCRITDTLLQRCRQQVTRCRTTQAELAASLASIRDQNTPEAARLRAELLRVQNTMLPNCDTMEQQNCTPAQSHKDRCTQEIEHCGSTLSACTERTE